MKLSVDKVNWPDAFPYCPKTSVEIDNNRDFLFLKFAVRGEQLRAVTVEDQGPVWEDSCVEFFCQVPGDRHYMNFEPTSTPVPLSLRSPRFTPYLR